METTVRKRGGRRLHAALSDRAVKAATAPGRMFDGNGLFLIVTPSGAKCWKQRITVNGRRQELGLGGYPVVTLAKAREVALANRRAVREGLNPKVERRRARGIPTFAELARADFEHRKSGWRNTKHAAQWIGTLEEFAFPLIGERTVDDITTDDVFRVLSPIWHTKPTTAKRLRQRIGAVLAVAVAKGHRSDNPADTVKAMLSKHQSVETKGHRSLPYDRVGDAVIRVRASQAWIGTRLSFEFLVLCAARAGEVRFATWSEFDTDAATWTIPGERMKSGREHRVPLSARALEILAEARALGTGRADLIFPGRTGRPIAERAFVQVLDRLGIDATAHGFRSSFRVWAAERTTIPREVCEAALAHTVKDKSEAAYQTSDLLEKRADLMRRWCDYLSRSPNASTRRSPSAPVVAARTPRTSPGTRPRTSPRRPLPRPTR